MKVKKILLGNEAIVQGALEAGVQFVSAYPGTPSSEVGMVFGKIAKKHGVYFEFSTNEKVAVEAGIGACFSGLKTLVAMKSFGLNVASDAFLPFVYTGTKGPFVLLVADDPSCHSSGQSEQNTRAYGELAHVPILEPADPKEAKEFVKLGFKISEKFNIPVILRTTTRVAHQRMPVEIETVNSKQRTVNGRFVKNPKRFVTMPPRVLEMKDELLEKIEKVREYAEKSEVNRCPSSPGGRGRASTDFGIITSGVSYLYVKEVLQELKLNIPVLKIGMFYPLAVKKVKDFIKGKNKVLVVEELEGYLEKDVRALAKEVNCPPAGRAGKLKIYGKDLLPISRELGVEKVGRAIAKLANKKYLVSKRKEIDIPKRFPRLCEGCPYWLVFSALKKLAPKTTIWGGDIGCYMLAGFEPHEIQDYLLCMGASIGVSHGIRKSTKQKVVALIGDSTFFHAGIPALINIVYNNSNPLIVVMDNRITAMTGHQPNPGMGQTGMGEACPEIQIKDIVKAVGVKHVKVVDPINFKELQETIKEYLDKKEAAVIIMKRICTYYAKKLKKYAKK